jgi:adenylate cyclase
MTPTAGMAIALRDLRDCFEGGVPAVISTASADGTPNVTYLSRVRLVDDERVALSNQFFSKTARNLAENPRANLLVVDATTFDEYRLWLVYERTDRRGPVFERLREDVEVTAALGGMEDVFRLRSADIYRVVGIEQVLNAVHLRGEPSPIPTIRRRDVGDVATVSELSARLSRCLDLNTLMDATVQGLDDLFGYRTSLLMLLDEEGRRLYTIASHGYEAEGVGSEVNVGEGMVGAAAARCAPIRVSSLRQMAKYSRSVRRAYEDRGDIEPGCDIPVPGLADAASRIAVPLVALGELVGVLLVESRERVLFDETDEAVLGIVGALVATAIEAERARDRTELVAPVARGPVDDPTGRPTGVAQVRFFAVDGSTFIDGDYLIKGVAGRILWSLLGHYEREGRTDFSNREIRLDPTLELPEFRDNFESRLILLKRRLDEQSAPVRIEKTGRGQFRLRVDTTLQLVLAGAG